MKINELQKWYCLGNDGKIRYIGEFYSFDEADDAIDDTAIWLFTEGTARQWLADLKAMLETGHEDQNQ